MSNPGPSSQNRQNYGNILGIRISDQNLAYPDSTILSNTNAVYQTEGGTLWQSNGVRLVQVGLSSAQANAVAGKTGGNVEVWAPQAGGYSSSAFTSPTWQVILSSRSQLYQVRVGYWNSANSGAGADYTVDKTAIYASTTYTPDGDPSNTTGVNLSFGGSASVTVTAPGAQQTQAFGTFSDWATISTTAWSGNPGNQSLLYIRSYQAVSTSTPYLSSGTGYPIQLPPGPIRSVGAMNNADKIATPTGYVGGGGFRGFCLPMQVEMRSLSKTVNVLGIGDSITAGAGTHPQGQMGALQRWWVGWWPMPSIGPRTSK